MQTIGWKSRQKIRVFASAGDASPRNGLGAYLDEYRKAMLAAGKVEQMAGHLDRAALLTSRDYGRGDR